MRALRDNGLLEESNRQLVAAARQAEGRAADPSAGVIDSQSVRTTESGGVRAMTPASGSMDASVTSSPIPSASWLARKRQGDPVG